MNRVLVRLIPLLGLIALGACERRSKSVAAPTSLRPSAGSTSADAPAVALALIVDGPELVTDMEFVPGRAREFVVTSQRGQALLFSLPEQPGALATSRGKLLELSVESSSEMGLLAIAFHPAYAENGRLFVHYNPAGARKTRLAEYRLPIDQLGSAPAVEQRVLLEVEQPYMNHNGGELAFGPDGKLYLGLGDGGSRGDPHGNGQNRETLLGSILRLDVDRGDGVPEDNPFVDQPGRPEIYAYGLRNPWKISFAPDGRLIVADVGQNLYEEVDIVQAGDNLGWKRREASHCFAPPTGCAQEGAIDPVFEYGRDQGGSVTGGYVYTGAAIPALRGRYVFGDFLSRRVWALALPADRSQKASSTVLGVFEGVSSAAFGRDAEGELYISDYGSGRIYKFVSP